MFNGIGRIRMRKKLPAILCLGIGMCVQHANAAFAENLFVRVSSSTSDVSEIIVDGNDFYIATQNVPNDFTANVIVEPLPSWMLISPNPAKMTLAIGERGGYRVRNGSSNEDASSGDIILVGLKTETVATVPSDRNRRTVGVGEEVRVSFLPNLNDGVAWGVSGGSLRFMAGSVMFNADSKASTANVIASCDDIFCSVSFTVIEPSGVVIERAAQKTWHIKGTASAGFLGQPYLRPTNVSFSNVEIREQTVRGIGSGFYENRDDEIHPIGNWIALGEGSVDKPNKVNGIDRIRSSAKEPPFSSGSFIWAIPWEYRVSNGEEETFDTVAHMEVADANGRVVISKGGATAYADANDSTSDFK